MGSLAYNTSVQVLSYNLINLKIKCSVPTKLYVSALVYIAVNHGGHNECNR